MYCLRQYNSVAYTIFLNHIAWHYVGPYVWQESSSPSVPGTWASKIKQRGRKKALTPNCLRLGTTEASISKWWTVIKPTPRQGSPGMG